MPSSRLSLPTALAYCHFIPLPLAQIGLSSTAKHIWRSRVRPEVFTRYGLRCYYCGATEAQAMEHTPAKRHSPFDCHEMWKFDDERLTARLTRIVPLCRDCHLLTGGGGVWRRDEQGHDYEHMDHTQWLALKAGISPVASKKVWLMAGNIWRGRNRTERWQVDYGEWHWVMKLAPGELWQPPLKDYQVTVRRQLPLDRRRKYQLKYLIHREYFSRRPHSRTPEGQQFDEQHFEGLYRLWYGEDIPIRIDPETLRFAPAD